MLTLAATGSTLESLYSHKFLLTPRPIYAKILTAFAVQANLIKLFKVDAAENLGCLHGLRFLSMCWVVLGHTWSVLTYGAIWNGLRIESVRKFHANENHAFTIHIFWSSFTKNGLC